MSNVRLVCSYYLLFVFMNSLLNAYCHEHDICSGSSVTAVERVTFLDGVQRLFVSSGQHYWFVNATTDLLTSDNAKLLPYGFIADAALIKDTRRCNGQYVLLLIERRHIKESNEEEWRTMQFTIKQWGDNGTDSGNWSEPVRIAHCSGNSKVCTTSDNYFATMNFDFKRALDAAFGVIGGNAYFIQGSQLFNVTYKSECVYSPYTDVIAKQPESIQTAVTAGMLSSDGQIVLFDREYYIDLSDELQNGYKEISNWRESPHNFFTACPRLERSIFYEIFYDSRTRSLSVAAFVSLAVLCLIFIVLLIVCVIWYNMRRRSMRISKAKKGIDANDAPQHEEHLLSNDTQKEPNGDSKDTNQPFSV